MSHMSHTPTGIILVKRGESGRDVEFGGWRSRLTRCTARSDNCNYFSSSSVISASSTSNTTERPPPPSDPPKYPHGIAHSFLLLKSEAI